MGILPIGFFAPLPLAIMIPFMAAQSFAMGHAFGTSFQYGKRKISSMSNEEFNALSATDLHGTLQADIRAMIPDMHSSFTRMEDFQIDIINSMLNTIKKAGEQFLGFVTNTPSSSSTQQETSAFEYGESGIVEIQGGSRQDNALTSDNPRSNLFLNEAGQTYDEWVAEGSQETFEIIKKTKSKIEKDIQRSRDTAKRIKPIVKITNAPVFVTPKVNLAHRKAQKAQLLKNISSQTAIVALSGLELKRLKAYYSPRIKNPRIQSATVKQMKISLRKLIAINADKVQKLNNMKRLLRNYKI